MMSEEELSTVVVLTLAATVLFLAAFVFAFSNECPNF